MNQWSRSSSDFKAVMDEVIFARYKAPMSSVRLHMNMAQAHITDPLKNLTTDQKDCLFDVLNGKIMPPK